MHHLLRRRFGLPVAIAAATLSLSAPALSGSFASGEDSADGPETLFIRAGRLIVRPGEVLEAAHIVVSDGKILAVGTDLAPPEGARVLESAVVCAGFVDPWSALGLFPGTINDGSTSASSRTVDGIDLYSNEHLRREALRAGVTCVRVQGAVTAPVAGVGAVLRLGADLSRDDAVVLEDANVAMSIGLTRRGSQVVPVVGLQSATKAMDPFDRIAELDRVIGALEKGSKYLVDSAEFRHDHEEWTKKIAEQEEELEDDWDKKKKSRKKDIEKAEEKGKEHKDKKYKEDKKPSPPKYDADLEAMARVVNGELPLVVQAHRAAEIRGLLDGTEKFDRLRLIVAGATEALPLADVLAERAVPVLLWPTPVGVTAPDEWKGHDLSLAGRLEDAGVGVLLGSGGRDAGATRDLPLLAELAVGHGLDRETAFAALTVGAARAFDLGDRLGSVERGKDADLLLLDGEPLVSTTRVLFVIAGGRVAVTPEDE